MPNPYPLFPPEKLLKYPHMLVEDVAIWERFLGSLKDGFESFAYDVAVGEGVVPKPEWGPEIQKMSMWLSRKRIDVVGLKAGAVFIIEVKKRASLSAIGQVLSYVSLYKKDFKPATEPLPMIVTDLEVPDLKFLCKEFNIIYSVNPLV